MTKNVKNGVLAKRPKRVKKGGFWGPGAGGARGAPGAPGRPPGGGGVPGGVRAEADFIVIFSMI